MSQINSYAESPCAYMNRKDTLEEMKTWVEDRRKIEDMIPFGVTYKPTLTFNDNSVKGFKNAVNRTNKNFRHYYQSELTKAL